MIRYLFLFIFLISAQSSFTQEEAAVVETIKTLFDGMRAGDSTAVRSAFASNARMQTFFTDRSGQHQSRTGSLDEFVTAVGTPHDAIWDEKIWSYETRIDGLLAQVWTEYTFYVGDKLSHCGVNAFHLFKKKDGWKITQITDTRRRKNCQEDLTPQIDTLINNWHLAAATGDENVFFGSMGTESIYIGTDATERWSKDVFEEWSKKYFERETAWDFKPIERAVYFSDDRKVAWFNETLDTWMGICRGSGVVEQTADGWKLQHYHLSVTVPNEKIEDFLKIVNPKKKDE